MHIKTPSEIYPAWVNAPSTLQASHALHGQRGFVIDQEPRRPLVTLLWMEGNASRSSLVSRTSVLRLFHSTAEQESARR